MEFEEFKSKIKFYLSKDELEKAISELLAFFVENDEHNQLIVQSAHYERLKRRDLRSLTTMDQYDATKNKIINNILSILDSIENKNKSELDERLSSLLLLIDGNKGPHNREGKDKKIKSSINWMLVGGIIIVAGFSYLSLSLSKEDVVEGVSKEGVVEDVSKEGVVEDVSKEGVVGDLSKENEFIVDGEVYKYENIQLDKRGKSIVVYDDQVFTYNEIEKISKKLSIIFGKENGIANIILRDQYIKSLSNYTSLRQV